MKKLTGFLCSIVLVLGVVGPANSALIDREGGLIYDTVLDITWLQNANYSGGTAMNWYQAMAWADNLEYYDSVRDVTWTEWRLPATTMGQSQFVYEGEMGHLSFLDKIKTSDPGPFSIREHDGKGYWTETDAYFTPNTTAWVRWMSNGDRNSQSKIGNSHYAWAVMDGDVLSPPVPFPPQSGC